MEPDAPADGRSGVMWKTFGFVLGVGVLLAGGAMRCAAAAEENAVDEDALWQSLAGRPNPALMDDFEVIEGMTLVAAGNGISPEAALAATVVCDALRPPRWRQDDDYGFAYALQTVWLFSYLQRMGDEYGDGPTNRDYRGAVAFAVKATSGVTDRRLRAERAVPPVLRGQETGGVIKGLIMQSYCLETDGIEEAVRKFAAEARFGVRVQNETPASFATIRDAVLMGIPAILTSGDESVLCTGVLASGEEWYLEVYDPREGELVQLTGDELVHPVDRRSEDPLVKEMVKMQMNTVLYRDAVLELSSRRPAGVHVVRFDPEKWSALYVYGWEPDVAGAVDDFVRQGFPELMGDEAQGDDRTTEPDGERE
jgi:hypothetical protein